MVVVPKRGQLRANDPPVRYFRLNAHGIWSEKVGLNAPTQLQTPFFDDIAHMKTYFERYVGLGAELCGAFRVTPEVRAVIHDLRH